MSSYYQNIGISDNSNYEYEAYINVICISLEMCMSTMLCLKKMS